MNIVTKVIAGAIIGFTTAKVLENKDAVKAAIGKAEKRTSDALTAFAAKSNICYINRKINSVEKFNSEFHAKMEEVKPMLLEYIDEVGREVVLKDTSSIIGKMNEEIENPSTFVFFFHMKHVERILQIMYWNQNELKENVEYTFISRGCRKMLAGTPYNILLVAEAVHQWVNVQVEAEQA